MHVTHEISKVFFNNFYVFFFSLGIGISAWYAWTAYNDSKHVESTQAKIITVRTSEPNSRQRHQSIYYPTVSFRVSEKQYTAEVPESCGPDCVVGSDLTVFYRTDNPNQIHLSDRQGTFSTSLLVLVGFIIMAVKVFTKQIIRTS